MITPTTSIADHSIDERVLVLLDEEIAPLIAYNSAVGADGIAAFDGNLRVRLHFAYRWSSLSRSQSSQPNGTITFHAVSKKSLPRKIWTMSSRTF
jgi:hypothetical protein